MQSHHILALKENTQGGKDYIMGDIHGNSDVLETVLKQLNANDRLFVAGDLTDRGPGSYKVVELVLEYQKEHPDRLFVARGNHEDFCLNTIRYLDDVADKLHELDYTPENTGSLRNWIESLRTSNSNTQLFEDVKCHLLSGGEWLVELYKFELYNGDITIYKTEDGDFEVTYETTSRIRKIEELFIKLPYQITRKASPFHGGDG